MPDNERFLEQADDHLSSLDGYYIISTDDDGIFIAVYPPQGSGAPVKAPEIYKQLEGRGIVKVDNALLTRVIKEALGTPVKISEIPVLIEPEIQVTVSRDRMEASLQISAPKGSRPVNRDEVVAKINQAGIVCGIDSDAIEAAIERLGNKVICARGLKPTDGVNASITYYIDLESKGRPVELEDGRVDFKNLHMFTTVQKDELLAEKVPPTEGIPGVDILGNAVPARPGKDTPFPVGKNAYVEELKIYAALSGQLVIANNKINVIPVIEVKGDVDLSTGNIEFVGSVVVQGSVQPGFIVKADGNVEIAGNVCGGIIEGKNIHIRMGIQGMHRGYVKASESVVTKYIENAVVHAGTDIIVSDVILHSKVFAGKRIVVEEKRGLIVGGQASAAEEIRAKVIGTSSATNTDVEVGVNPHLRQEYIEVRKEVKKLENNLEQTQKALSILKAMDQSTMPPDRREMQLKLTKAQFHLIGQIETIRNRLAEIEIALEEMRFGYIKVADVVYPSVKIVIGTLVKPVRDPIKFAKFYAEDGEIKVGPYK